MGPTFCHDALGCTALCWHEQAWHVGRENHSLVDMDVHVAINEPVACEQTCGLWTNLWLQLAMLGLTGSGEAACLVSHAASKHAACPTRCGPPPVPPPPPHNPHNPSFLAAFWPPSVPCLMLCGITGLHCVSGYFTVSASTSWTHYQVQHMHIVA